MFNSKRPHNEDLPSTGQLFRATAIAIVAASAILVTIVLPSEYAIDATGIGRQLGLTEMGEIKAQLAEEAARDAAVGTAATAPAVVATAETVSPTKATDVAAKTVQEPPVLSAAPVPAPAVVAAAKTAIPSVAAVNQRSDTMKLTLAPGEGAEIKATMTNGAKLSFDWSVDGGQVNFDTHADAPGISYHGYGKGKESTGDKGELVAAFDGNHGWFWRNRSDGPVTITLRTKGAYTDIRRAG